RIESGLGGGRRALHDRLSRGRGLRGDGGLSSGDGLRGGDGYGTRLCSGDCAGATTLGSVGDGASAAGPSGIAAVGAGAGAGTGATATTAAGGVLRGL